MKTDLFLTVVINPQLSGIRVSLQDEYTYKIESESKLWAGFSLQTPGSAFEPATHLQIP